MRLLDNIFPLTAKKLIISEHVSNQPWLERCVCGEKGEKTFLIAKNIEEKNLVVVLDFVAVANLKFPNIPLIRQPH